ncbi:lipid A export permease/ATP-binding protein MsbA [Permianibacter sp. IMCC34836]|uniref:lipid A export permease/ATP-binding protein MsbA n=1 Tax=Permianibacter fluminis TaxID=2738515 RepID=UPI001553C9E1|nr:lipid A export permease/ATP-binding protein MsbA [Permianibacter fluminis]NQD37630.1 lipid A export permease/ATP-binding protein MsbA [Permianibacter fluminis]
MSVNPKMPVSSTSMTPWQVYKRLLTYLKPYLWIFIAGIIANALFSAVDGTLMNGMKKVVDDGFVKKDAEFLTLLPIYVLLYGILRAFFSFASEYCMGYVGRGIVQDLRQQLFDKYMRMPAAFFDARTTGDLISTLTFNVDRIGTAATEAIKDIVREGAGVFIYAGIVFYNSWQLGALFFIGGPLIVWVLREASKRFRRISKNMQAAMGMVTNVATQSVQGYRTIKTFGGEEHERNAFYKAADGNRRQQLKMIVTKALSVTLIYLIAGVALAGVLYVAAGLIARNELTPGAFVAAFMAMVTIQKPLRTLSSVNATLQQGIAAANSIFEFLDMPDEVDNGVEKLDRAKGRLDVSSVVFCYPGKTQQVLREISFTVPAGKTVALVGRSGSGKSTLASLLLRLYHPQAGQIQLDGIDIERYQLADYRRQFAFVSQQVTLFNDSVRNNIAYGDMKGASDEAIINAAKLANAWEFISALPEGLDTKVGDNGINLSGGQRQRLAIARALLKDAPVLVLDEATSALDNESERQIQNALEKLMQNRTTIVIAHRLSTIEQADQILVLDQGVIVEQGSHRELLAQNGEYAKLHAMQFRDGAEA